MLLQDMAGICKQLLIRGLLGLVDPGLLNCLQHFLPAALVVVVEVFQVDHEVMQVDEADGQGGDVRMLVEQFFGDALYVSSFHDVDS